MDNSVHSLILVVSVLFLMCQKWQQKDVQTKTPEVSGGEGHGQGQGHSLTTEWQTSYPKMDPLEVGAGSANVQQRNQIPTPVRELGQPTAKAINNGLPLSFGSQVVGTRGPLVVWPMRVGQRMLIYMSGLGPAGHITQIRCCAHDTPNWGCASKGGQTHPSGNRVALYCRTPDASAKMEKCRVVVRRRRELHGTCKISKDKQLNSIVTLLSKTVSRLSICLRASCPKMAEFRPLTCNKIMPVSEISPNFESSVQIVALHSSPVLGFGLVHPDTSAVFQLEILGMRP